MENIIQHVMSDREAKYFPKAYKKNLVTIDDFSNYINRTNANDKELAIIKEGKKIETPVIKYDWRNSWNNKLLESCWNDGYLFVLHTIQINDSVKDLIKFFEKETGFQFDAHTYCGKYNSKSYNYHSDVSNNLILQCQGHTRWKIYPLITKQPSTFLDMKLDPCIDVIMNPGDIIWIPKFQVHYAEPVTDRISVSFPFSSKCFNGTTIQSPLKLEINTQRHWRYIDG